MQKLYIFHFFFQFYHILFFFFQYIYMKSQCVKTNKQIKNRTITSQSNIQSNTQNQIKTLSLPQTINSPKKYT